MSSTSTWRSTARRIARCSGWSSDLLRANEVAITGDRQLAFSSFAVRRERWLVADQLARMARRCGWRGPLPSREEFERRDAFDRRGRRFAA